MKYTVNSHQSLSVAIGELRSLFDKAKFFTMTLKHGKKRTLSQNAIAHTWYAQVADEEHEYTAEGVKCLCKLHYGLPLLRGEDDEVNAAAEMVIDLLPYENKIEAMKYFPITSLMTTKQLNKYLDHVQDHYAGRVPLRFPDELL